MSRFIKWGSAIILAFAGIQLAYAAVTVTVNGTNYTIPQTNEKGWGTNVTSWIQGISGAALYPNSGTFTLGAELDFGASYGLKSLYYKSRTANPASSGQIRLANTDGVYWRNSGNSGNLSLLPGATDGILSYNSVDLVGTSLSQTLTNKTIDAASNTISNIANANVSGSAAIAYSKLNLSGSVVNADVSGSAAIARSKLASGSASHVVINDGSGAFSSEAQLASTRGGTGVSNSGTLTYGSNNISLTTSGATSLTLPTSGTVSTLAGSENLTNKTITQPTTDILNLDDQASTPSSPSSGFYKLYVKTDGNVYKLNSSGSESKIGAGASGLYEGGANVIQNNSWESDTSLWTASGGTYTRTTTAANIIPPGVGAASWDSNGASQTFTYSDVTVTSGDGLSGQNAVFSCAFKSASGTATHKIQIVDGSTTLAETSITSSTSQFVRTSINTIFPTSTTTLRARITSVASDEPTLYIDDCFLGRADNFNLLQVSQASLIGSAYFATTASCDWTRASSSIGAFGTTAACPGPTVELNPGPGTIQTTDADLPQITVNNAPPGVYKVTITGTAYQTNAADDICFAVTDGTTTSPNQCGKTGFATTGGKMLFTAIGIFNKTSAGNFTFALNGANNSATVTVLNSSNLNQTRFTIERFPSSTEQAYKADGLPSFAYANHANDCSWSSTSTSFADPSDDATCTFTASSTNAKNLTLSSVGSVSPKITWTPDRARDYEVCAMVALSNGTVGASTGFSLTDGSNNALPGGYTDYADTGGNIMSTKLACGKLTASSTSAVIVKARIAVNGGTGKFAAAGTGGLVSVSIPTIQWSVKALDTLYGVPLLVGSVTTDSSGGTLTKSNTITCSSSASAVVRGTGGISISNGSGTGKCNVTFSPAFSAVPQCTCSIMQGLGASYTQCDFNGGASASGITDLGRYFNGAYANGNLDLVCVGPR